MRFFRTAATRFFFCLIFLVIPAQALSAVPVPGPADAGRIKPEERQIIPDRTRQQPDVVLPSAEANIPTPENAKDIFFTLKDVRIDGATVFSPEELRKLYAEHLGRRVSLYTLYALAETITQRYRAEGYFLSLAFVPDQHIKNKGVAVIKAVEGYVGKVDIDGDLGNNGIVKEYIDRLLQEKPLKAETLESFILRLNDLPGHSFRAVLSSHTTAQKGAITLAIIPAPKEGIGLATIDNLNSRYLGSQEASLSYTTSFIPLQQTSFSVQISIPPKPLKTAAINHSIIIAPDVTLNFSGSFTHTRPGYTLRTYDIASASTFIGTSLSWQWIRQRQENLVLRLSLDGRDVDTDMLGSTLTRDRIRAARASIGYDNLDDWLGSNSINFTLSHGLNVFGASAKNAPNLSRADATPYFLKGEMFLSRLQNIDNDWSALLSMSGQATSDTLYSSEQYGYGGQTFGRAYDLSEFTGDEGISGSLEMRYNGLNSRSALILTPYAFMDIGKVWNNGSGERSPALGASAGFGIRGSSDFGLFGNFGLAWPISHGIGTPNYPWASKSGPRLMFQISMSF